MSLNKMTLQLKIKRLEAVNWTTIISTTLAKVAPPNFNPTSNESSSASTLTRKEIEQLTKKFEPKNT